MAGHNPIRDKNSQVIATTTWTPRIGCLYLFMKPNDVVVARQCNEGLQLRDVTAETTSEHVYVPVGHIYRTGIYLIPRVWQRIVYGIDDERLSSEAKFAADINSGENYSSISLNRRGLGTIDYVWDVDNEPRPAIAIIALLLADPNVFTE